jgi:hypothetical protein
VDYRYPLVNPVRDAGGNNPMTRALPVGHTCSEASVGGASMEGAILMGLDMYIYGSKEAPLSVVDTPVNQNDEEFFYWRKDYALQHWFNRLYLKKGGKGTSDERTVLVTPDDLDDLEVIQNILGIAGSADISTEIYIEDLSRFIDRARRAYKDGFFLYYWESR